MSAIGVQSQINKDRALWLSTIPSDVVHGNIICDTILANAGYISTLYTDNLNVSTLNASTLSVKSLDVSGMYVSSITGNFGKFSTLQWASDLSGGVGYVNITSDASGVAVTGDPIVFNNLVYLTSTINIVQVSTIVDTDIFASNGYFSTLSSGSISANQMMVNDGFFSSLQGDYGSFNRLFVSSLEALDISGVDGARYWSQYPTLASSITFQPGFVLSNVNNQLYFAGQELTDASGGGADWSVFPAYTDVSMNNFSLRGLSTLEYQDGGKLYSQTGNNLFYNGQPVQFGAVSNVSQWANYPAVNTIQTGGFPISSLGHLNLVANSNIRLLAEQISSVADNGIDITTTSKIDLTAQNGYKGQINMTANPGYQGLFGEINMTANGGTVAGVGTGGLVSITANTPLGTLCNATSAIKLSASGVNSYAGAIPSIGSLAGYNFIYGQAGVNIVASVIPPVLPNIPLTTYLYGDAGVTTSSDLYVPNIYPYWNGLTTPPDMMISGRYIVPNLAQVYVQLSNVKHLYMDGAADIQNAKLVSTISTIGSVANFNQGQFGSVAAGAVGASAGIFTTLDADTISTGTITSASTITTTAVTNYAQVSSFLMGNGLILSTTIGDLRFNNAKVADDITGVTNAPMPLQSRIINFSSINSFNMSTTDLWVSSINGQPIDISGSPFVNTNTFSTLFTSSLRVSTLVGYSYPGNSLSTIFVEGGFQFSGDFQGQAFSGRFLSSLRNINSAGEDLNIVGGGLGKEFSILYPGGLPASNSYVRIGGGSAFDTHIFDYGGAGAISTGHLFTSSIIGHPVAGLDISGNVEITGGLFVNDTIELPEATGGINFDFGSPGNYTRLMRRDVAANNMLAVVNNTTEPAPEQINMMPLGVGELWLTGSSDQYQACRLYSVFPYGNYELDAIDADGATLFAYMQGYENGDGLNPGFLQAYSNVSSISGYDQESATNQMLHVINGVTTSNLVVSTINGVPVDGGSFDNQFSTLFVSSLNFSTGYSYMSNAVFNYPLFIEADTAGNTTTAGVAIAVQGHNLSAGAVRNQIEMGARATGENYIMSSWPGQNLEDLVIDATQVTFRDSDGFSTIVNENPYGIATNGEAKFGVGSGVVEISTGLIKVGGQTNLTPFAISTTFFNLPYGNEFYMGGGPRQPHIQFGSVATSGGSGSIQVQIATPYYDNSNYVVQATMRDINTAQMSAEPNSISSFTLYWSNGGGGSHSLDWTTFGNLPFTG